MTTVIDAPATAPTPPPSPRSPLGRGLLWTGAVLGALAIVWTALTTVGLIGSQRAEGAEHHDAAATVELVADGDVTVVGADVDGVDVDRRAWFAFRAPVYSATTADDRLVVSYRCQFDWLWECRSSLDVTVPAGTHVVIRSSDGTVRARELVGDVEARTSNGRVEVYDVDGAVQAQSSDGAVDVRLVTGPVEARTSNGSVVVAGAASVNARTSDGSVDVMDVEGAVLARSSNGAVLVENARDDIEATSSNGAVTVYGTGVAVALDISTSNGRQTVEAPTDPASAVHVTIRSSNGSVAFLGPRG